MNGESILSATCGLLRVDFGHFGKLRCTPMSQAQRKFRLPHPEPVDALVYARFTGISTFMRLPHISVPEELEVALIGVPFDGGTTYRPGPRFGPRHVRAQSAIIRPWNPVLHVNPFAKHRIRSEEHTSELQSPDHLVCRLLLEKKKKNHSHVSERH